MAKVASCPKCSCELVVSDEVAADAWAKCPECRAYFELKDAPSRELPVATVVPSDAVPTSEEPELSFDDFSSNAKDDLNLESDLDVSPETMLASDSSDETAIAPERTSDEVSAAQQRIDEWFRSAKTVPEINPPANDEISPTIDITAEQADELNVAANFELESTPADSPTAPAWDDSQRMDDLLGDMDSPELEEPEAAEPAFAESSAMEFDGEYEDAEFKIDGQVDEPAAPVAAVEASDDEAPQVVEREQKPRRKRSLVRTLAVSALAGLIGLAAGYNVLLWTLGPDGDFLKLAQYMPAAMLPKQFNMPGVRAASQPAPPPIAAAPATEPAAEEPAEASVDQVAADNSETQAEEPTEPADPSAEAIASDDLATEPAEVQASYDEPAEAENVTTRAQEDRYAMHAEPAGQEPAELEEPATADPLADFLGEPEAEQPAAEAAPAVTKPPVANAPSFTPQELAASLEAAEKVQSSLMTGSLSDGREVQRAKGFAYSMMADLAQKATLVDAASEPEQIAQLQQQAEQLFRTTLADSAVRTEVSVILPKWIASKHRKHGGVFFGGTIASPQAKGDVVEAQASLDGGQTQTLLMSPATAEELDASSRPVGIVGYMIEQPTQNVTGYAGDSMQAVWVGRVVPLE